MKKGREWTGSLQAKVAQKFQVNTNIGASPCMTHESSFYSKYNNLYTGNSYYYYNYAMSCICVCTSKFNFDRIKNVLISLELNS